MNLKTFVLVALSMKKANDGKSNEVHSTHGEPSKILQSYCFPNINSHSVNEDSFELFLRQFQVSMNARDMGHITRLGVDEVSFALENTIGLSDFYTIESFSLADLAFKACKNLFSFFNRAFQSKIPIYRF